MAATCNYFSCLPRQAPQLSESGLPGFLGLSSQGASHAWLTDRSLGWAEWGVQEERGIRLCSQPPSAVWMAAQHPARQLFSLVRLDPEAKPLVFIFLLRVLSAVSLWVPKTEESDLWQV